MIDEYELKILMDLLWLYQMPVEHVMVQEINLSLCLHTQWVQKPMQAYPK